MEAQEKRKSKKKERVIRPAEPVGHVPDAPTIEEFGGLMQEVTEREVNHVETSQTPKADHKSRAVTEDEEFEPSVVISPAPIGVEHTKDAKEDCEQLVSELNAEKEKKSMEANGSVVTAKESAPGETCEDLEVSVDPCEEALNFPSAPGETYSYSQEQSGLLYPALDALSLVYPESLSEKSSDEVLSAPQAITWIPQVLNYEFGESQIGAMYSNRLVESSDSKVEEFLNTTKTSYDGFELYELLSNYLRASNQLCGCERTLVELQERCTDYEKQLWTINSETLSQTAICDDGNQVVASHQFHVSNFDKQIYSQIDRTLKEIKELVKESFSLYTYSVQLCKTQIKHFFHKSFKDINLQSFEVQGYTNDYPTADIRKCASVLRMCLSTLFIFIRRPLCPQGFLKDCQQWVTDCVGLLLRIATLDDHIFIVNHVVRCPAGVVGKKLAQCVQIPKIPIPTSPSEYLNVGSNHLYLDFALCVLRSILRPVAKRDEFLKFAAVHVSMQGASGDTSQWVVVDSDGEDDPDDLSFFKENDLVNLFNQIPFANIFRRLLMVVSTDQGDVYHVSISNERSVLKMLAISSQLVDILGQGFVSYYTDRYRQLIKILGRLILHTVQYVTDHMEEYWEHLEGAENISRNPESHIICREYDLFFRSAVGVLFSGKNIGTLQFLAAIPYHLISSEMLWHIYCAVTKWNASETSISLSCPDISLEFENELVSMNDSDAFYLLTTLSNMAIARESLDASFVRVVTLHLFQIGFLSPLTRDSCSKTARDLLGNLTGKYPQIISVLLHTINTKMKILDKLSLYLLKELAFDFWKPSDLDIKLLSHWLVSFPTITIEHQTARFVIQSMNWDFDETGELFLPFDIHYQISLMIMESHLKWDKPQSLLVEGMKQMSALTNRGSSDTWAWDTVKRLHLHGFDRSSLGQIKLGGVLRNLPSFESHAELECVRKGVELKNPLGCLLSLYLTPFGHSVPIVCSRGFELVEILMQHYRMELVSHAIFFITPLFVGNLGALHSHEKFRGIITTLLTVDMTYMRLAKNLISSDFPGEVTRSFGEMILAQLNQSSRFGVSDKSLLRLWVETLTSLESWNKDNNILYLLDLLAKYSLPKEDCRSYFGSYFYKIYKDMPSQAQSGIISLFTWSTPITTLLPNPTYSAIPYLLYYILSVEMDLENSSGFWKSLCTGLNNPKTSLEAAVKRSSSATKFATTSSYLTIYRWAQLGIDLPNNHQLSFLVWQKFFLRYLHRVAENQTTTYACVAGRFFDGIINSAFLRKVKKKIEDLGGVCREALASHESSNIHENASENPILAMKLLTDRITLASAFALWIEDDQLLLPSLYLPALPPQYMPSLLLSLIDGEEFTWNDYVDFEAVAAECTVSAKTFLCTISRNCWFERCRIRRFSSLGISLSNKAEDILKRLKSYDEIMHPPPVPLFEDVVPVLSTDMFSNTASMKNGVKSHFAELQKYSSTFSLQVSQLISLNCGYWESLPELYTNNKVDMLVNARCSGTKNWEGCTGPARVLFKYTEARLNESLGHQIHQNRIEYHQLMDTKSTKPPPLEVCVAAVFVEDFITNLVIAHRAASNREDQQRIQFVGEDLFYQATLLLNDQSDFYPPTKQLFSSLLEVLGNEFVASKPGQSRRLVSTCIGNPRLIGSLAPHLNLANCSPPVLIDIYKDVANIPRRDIDLQFVILTKFDINAWLVSVKPKLNERSQLLALIWKALTSDGLSPDEEKLMVHDTFRNHLKSMLLYDFPQHYGEILTFLLHGIDQRTISVNLWYDFCNGLSRDFVRFSHGMDAFTRKREVKRFATEGSILEHQELIETAQLLAHHFTKERLTHGLYGLYSKYREYIEPLSCFIQMISYSIEASSLKNARGMLSQKIIDSVWPIVKDMYAPWILPYNHKFIQHNCAQWVQLMNYDSNTVLQPWIGSDSNLAMIIVNDFTDCVMFLVETLPGTSAVFSYLWNFYVENFAQPGVKEHVLGVVHNCFVSVPWAMFWPTFSDVETMCKVVERFLPICHSFLSVVFAQVSWLEWIGSLGPKLNAKGHGMLLNLTVRLANDSVARESPSWIHVMERAETKINWLCIPSNSLEPVLNWFVMGIDPRVVLRLESNHPMDNFLLRLLKAASGYGFLDEAHRQSAVDLNNKRYIYVRSVIRLVLSAASKHKSLLDTNASSFEEGIQDIISDIVDVIRSEGQTTETFLPHLREVVSLMSNHILMTISRNAIISWCLTHSRPPLNFLLALIQLSNSLKVHAYAIAPLLETVITLCFQHSDTTWDSICEATKFNPEEINNFFEVTSKDGHYLVLYTLFKKRYRNLVTGGEHSIMHLTELVKFLKPKESNEEGLPLLYGTILNIISEIYVSTKSLSGGKDSDQPVKKFLRTFSQHLNLVGEDKQGWGLLTALGIGKASQLSIRGRLFAKSLALFVLVQLPTGTGIRIDSQLDGHFCQEEISAGKVKPHAEVQSCLEKLEALKINRQYSDFIECIDSAISFTKDPNHTLSHTGQFISKLNGFLFNARYLM